MTVNMTFEKFCETFNIPTELKHDHTPEAMRKLDCGIKLTDILLEGGHPECVNHMVKYAELNIKLFFMLHLLDRNMLVQVFDLYLKNMFSIFMRGVEGVKPYEALLPRDIQASA